MPGSKMSRFRTSPCRFISAPPLETHDRLADIPVAVITFLAATASFLPAQIGRELLAEVAPPRASSNAPLATVLTIEI